MNLGLRMEATSDLAVRDFIWMASSLGARHVQFTISLLATIPENKLEEIMEQCADLQLACSIFGDLMDVLAIASSNESLLSGPLQVVEMYVGLEGEAGHLSSEKLEKLAGLVRQEKRHIVIDQQILHTAESLLSREALADNLVSIPNAASSFLALQLRQDVAGAYISAMDRSQFPLSTAILEATSVSPIDSQLLGQLDQFLTELLAANPVPLLILTSPNSDVLVDMVDLVHRRERKLNRASLILEEFFP